MFDFQKLCACSNEKLVCVQSAQNILQIDLETAEMTLTYFEGLGYLQLVMISDGVKYWSITPKAEAIWCEQN